MQANLNHAQAAQDLLTQWSLKKGIELAAVQEPWSTVNSDYWFKSKNGLAAIYWNRGATSIPCKIITEGRHLIAVRYKKLVLVSCYSSPNAPQQEYEELLHEIRGVVTKVKSKVIVCGDFNAKSPAWSDKTENKRGKELLDMMDMLGLRLVNIGTSATCVRPQGTSIVDTTWSSVDLISKIHNWKVEEDEVSLSDHRYITFTITSDRASEQNDKAKRTAWVMKKFDEDLFHSVFIWECPQMLRSNMEELSPQEVSLEIDGIMTRAYDAAMPRQLNKFRKKEAVYWWSSEIDAKRKECIKIRRKWKRNRKRVDRDSDIEKEEEYKHAKKELRYLIRKAKTNAWKDLIRTIDEDPWGLPYRLVMNRLRRTSPSLSEMLGKQVLENTISKLFPAACVSKERSEDTELEWQEEWDISPQDLYRYTKKRTSANTAPGLDGVKFLYWKRINAEMMECVAKLFTMCCRSSIFPNQWKVAQLVLIPKGVLDPECPKVRPICLLPEIGKILERILTERINIWMEEHPESALSQNQFGFRMHRSTVDAIVELREFIEFAHKEDGTVIAVALDIENAFNSLQWADIM